MEPFAVKLRADDAGAFLCAAASRRPGRSRRRKLASSHTRPPCRSLPTPDAKSCSGTLPVCVFGAGASASLMAGRIVGVRGVDRERIVRIDWQYPWQLPPQFRNHCAFEVFTARPYCSNHCGSDYQFLYCSKASFGCCHVGRGYWRGGSLPISRSCRSFCGKQ